MGYVIRKRRKVVYANIGISSADQLHSPVILFRQPEAGNELRRRRREKAGPTSGFPQIDPRPPSRRQVQLRRRFSEARILENPYLPFTLSRQFSLKP